MVISGSGTDIFRAVVAPGEGCCAWPGPARRIKERAAQVLEVAEPVAGHGQAAPAATFAPETPPDKERSPDRRSNKLYELEPSYGIEP
jgi:hypothetical protein